MKSSEHFFLGKAFNPFFQGLIALAAILAILLASKLVHWSGLIQEDPRFPWQASTSIILVFVIFNSVFSLSSEEQRKYYGRSIYSYMALAFLGGLLAWLFSSIPISEAGSYRWIYIVITISYMIFLGMVAFLKRIVNFAQKEEWNHPRIRRNKRKR